LAHIHVRGLLGGPITSRLIVHFYVAHPVTGIWVKLWDMATDSATGSNTRPAVEESKNSDNPKSRQDRLAEIQAQVQNGTYKIDALELSKRIIQKHIVR
jgi:hypothetical protein